jgi:hypothetical protein
MRIEVIVDVKTTLGQRDFGVEQERLYWIDSFDGRVPRHGGHRNPLLDVPQKIGSMALRKDGGGAVALARGLPP